MLVDLVWRTMFMELPPAPCQMLLCHTWYYSKFTQKIRNLLGNLDRSEQWNTSYSCDGLLSIYTRSFCASLCLFLFFLFSHISSSPNPEVSTLTSISCNTLDSQPTYIITPQLYSINTAACLHSIFTPRTKPVAWKHQLPHSRGSLLSRRDENRLRGIPRHLGMSTLQR